MKRTTIRPLLENIAVPSPTLPPATKTNAWILGRHTIIDPAATRPKHKKELISILEKDPPKSIFLTHHHNDHIGSATALREHFQIPISCSSQTAEKISFSVDVIRKDGEKLLLSGEEWVVLETPGHAKGHLCLFSPAGKEIVAGDMVAGEGTILLVPGDGDFGDYIAQLNRLKALQPTMLLPAHGPAIHDAVSYLQHYINHRQKRLQQIFDHLEQTPQSELQLARRIYTDIPSAFHPIAAQQILCHLQYLHTCKKAKTHKSGWILAG